MIPNWQLSVGMVCVGVGLEDPRIREGNEAGGSFMGEEKHTRADGKLGRRRKKDRYALSRGVKGRKDRNRQFMGLLGL